MEKRQRLVLLLSNLLKLVIIYKRQRRKSFRRWFVKPHLLSHIRDKYSAHYHLFITFALNDHEEFEKFIRMSLENFMGLFDMVQTKLQKHSRRKPLSADFRLAVVPHTLAHGNCCGSESWLFRIGRSTMYKLIIEVCHVLCEVLIPIYMKFPTQEKWLEIAEGFKEWNFENCIGALDGKHFAVQKPEKAGAKFKNYKKFHILVLLALCDSKKRFIWINIGDFGSFSDSSIFLQTDLYRMLRDDQANLPPPRALPGTNVKTPFVIVADEIFGLSKNIMKPYPRRNNLTHDEKIFNYRLSRCRLTIECTFGILCERWEILQNVLRFNVRNCDLIITAAIALHNFIMYRTDVTVQNVTTNNTTNKESSPSNKEIPAIDREDQEIIDDNIAPIVVRNRFRDYFVSPQGSVPWQEHYI